MGHVENLQVTAIKPWRGMRRINLGVGKYFENLMIKNSNPDWSKFFLLPHQLAWLVHSGRYMSDLIP